MPVSSLWVFEEPFFWISCPEVKDLLATQSHWVRCFLPSLTQSSRVFVVLHLAGSLLLSHGFSLTSPRCAGFKVWVMFLCLSCQTLSLLWKQLTILVTSPMLHWSKEQLHQTTAWICNCLHLLSLSTAPTSRGTVLPSFTERVVFEISLGTPFQP